MLACPRSGSEEWEEEEEKPDAWRRTGAERGDGWTGTRKNLRKGGNGRTHYLTLAHQYRVPVPVQQVQASAAPCLDLDGDLYVPLSFHSRRACVSLASPPVLPLLLALMHCASVNEDEVWSAEVRCFPCHMHTHPSAAAAALPTTKILNPMPAPSSLAILKTWPVLPAYPSLLVLCGSNSDGQYFLSITPKGKMGNIFPSCRL